MLDHRHARTEIVGCKRWLEQITAAPVTLFAYSNGKPDPDYGPRNVELVRQAGFAAALFTTPGAACRASDRTPRGFGLRLLTNCARGVTAAEAAA